MVIGRWWRDVTAEVDVLGMIGGKTALMGECRWQSGPLTARDLTELHRKVAYVPDPADDLMPRFWTRSGAAEPGFPVTAYSADDVIG
jgi:hypothetical protein